MSTLPENPSSPPFSWGRVLLVLVPALVVIGAVYAVNQHRLDEETRKKDATFRNQMGLTEPSSVKPMHLDEKFTDADGDLVADAPKDPALLVTPTKLIFAFIAGPDAEQDKPNWTEFTGYLSKQIGVPVEMVTFKTTEEEIQALKDGKLHVAGFNTGGVPLAVNTAGFVPVCTRAGSDGKFSDSMQIVVPAESAIRSQHLEDLKGHTIVFTDRTSNSGFKAAVVLLKEQGMDLPRDYSWRFSTGHFDSIKGIANGDYEVGPVSREMLIRAVSKGDVDMGKLRVVYESERFPPATLGYVYNLSPELAAKITKAFLDFDWSGTGLEKQFAGSGATKFVPVSYKNDFALIRRNADSVQDPTDSPNSTEKTTSAEGQVQ
jgi:phosphonate transport system substrate-binding protein